MQFLRAIGYGKPPVVVAGPHAPTLLLCIVALIALVGLFGGARRRWGYYLTSACLGAKCMYNFVVSCYYVFLHMHPNGAVAIPSQRNNWIATVVYLALLVFLFYRYTFGAPSRRYYGLGKAMEPPPLP
jgi:hypothetical protein